MVHRAGWPASHRAATLPGSAHQHRVSSDDSNLTSTGWDGLPIPLRVCEVRRNSKSRRPSLSGNSSESGRSVTSKIVAILLTFADGTLHPLTEIAGLTGIPTSTVHRLVSELVASASWSAPTMASTELACHCARSARRRMPYPACVNPPRECDSHRRPVPSVSRPTTHTAGRRRRASTAHPKHPSIRPCNRSFAVPAQSAGDRTTSVTRLPKAELRSRTDLPPIRTALGRRFVQWHLQRR